MDGAASQLPIGRTERGVALMAVLVVLASIALLSTGVFLLVSEGSRSAAQQVKFRITRSLSQSALEQSSGLIEALSIPGFSPAVPRGYGVAVGGEDQWNSRQAFADYLRDQNERASGGTGQGPNPCTQAQPDLRYTVQSEVGQVTVTACVERVVTGPLRGSGAGVIFARSGGNLADQEGLFRVTVWATGPQVVRAQVEGIARGLY